MDHSRNRAPGGAEQRAPRERMDARAASGAAFFAGQGSASVGPTGPGGVCGWVAGISRALRA